MKKYMVVFLKKETGEQAASFYGNLYDALTWIDCGHDYVSEIYERRTNEDGITSYCLLGEAAKGEQAR